jgi:high-affinity nickel-transport protein
VSEHFGLLGYLIVGVFVLSWLASMLIYRLKGYDRLELVMSPRATIQMPVQSKAA